MIGFLDCLYCEHLFLLMIKAHPSLLVFYVIEAGQRPANGAISRYHDEST